MSGVLPPPSGAGGGNGDRISPIAAGKNSVLSSLGISNTDRKLAFGNPTSQLSTTTDLSSQKAAADNKLRVSDDMSPVRNSVGKSVHSRKDSACYSEDISPPPGISVTKPGGRDVSPQTEGGERGGRWGSARARFGNVLGRHSIRESISKVRRKSVDPSHLMNDLNSRESLSRAGPEPPSINGSGQLAPPPPNVTAATSLADSTFPGRTEQVSNVPGRASPSRFSSKLSSWKNLGTPKGRGRESLQDQERTSDTTSPEQPRSSSTPPPQKFKIRVNRFLRSGKRSVSSVTGSPASAATTPATGHEHEHLESLASTSNAQTPPYLSSAESSTVRGTPRSGLGFRQAVRRGVSSARRRMSVPFLSTPPLPDNASVTGAPVIEPPERPQTVPLEKRGGTPRTSSGSRFILSGEPSHAFLPSETNNIIIPGVPPGTENPQAEDWLKNDFEHIPMTQSHPPLFPPGMEEIPPLSPWVKTTSEPQPWLKLTATPPRLPEISSLAPLELMTRDFTTTKNPSDRQGLSDTYWAVASGSGMGKGEYTQAKDKGKERAISNASDYLMPPGESFYPESSGKSIEVLDEEKRRKSRDTGIMGLGPEIPPNGDLPTTPGLGEKDDDGEFTYAAAVREIAGLGRFPKRPPPDTGTDDVSVPMPECDYDLPLPNFRFSIIPEPSSSSSNEPDVSPCVASSSLTQETPGSIPNFPGLGPIQSEISTTTTMTTTTSHTTTTASTNPSTSITSPSDYTPYNYQMLLSSKRPYLFVLQELSSGTCIKITPQKNSSPVSRSLSILTPSYPETPAPSRTSPGDARSPISMRFINSHGLLGYDSEAYEVDDDDEEEDKDNNEEEVRKKE